jgi:hypothetical protein
MKTQLKVTVNDEDVLLGLEKFMNLLKKEFPGTITWGEMPTTKKIEQEMSSIARAIATHKKRKEAE